MKIKTNRCSLVGVLFQGALIILALMLSTYALHCAFQAILHVVGISIVPIAPSIFKGLVALFLAVVMGIVAEVVSSGGVRAEQKSLLLKSIAGAFVAFLCYLYAMG